MKPSTLWAQNLWLPVNAIAAAASLLAGSLPADEFKPSGELKERIELTQHRLTSGGFPEYTIPFVVADM